MLPVDKKIFQENLLLTQRYCEFVLQTSVENTAAVLRTINPSYYGKQLFSFKQGKYGNHTWNETVWSRNPLLGNNAEFYSNLFESQLSYKRKAVENFDSTLKFEGRILVAEIENTTCDGASEANSDGFIDGNDCPPIDTWFYETRNSNGQIFYAWVPNRFIELTQVGIDVNMLDSLGWMDESARENDKPIDQGHINRVEDTIPYNYKTIFWAVITAVALMALVKYLLIT